MTDVTGQAVAPGAFLTVDEIADAPTLPDSITLSPVTHGIRAAVYESAGTAHAYVYALPAAGQVSVPSRSLPGLNREKPSAYSILGFEFSPAFDGRAIDGKTVMMSLKRFSRATAKIGTQKP